MNLTRCVLLGVFVLITIAGKAQSVENIELIQSVDSAQNPTFSINYDLISKFNNIPFVIKPKVVIGERSFYMKFVKGDVGNMIYPGTRKNFKWDYVKEMVHFSGDVQVQIEIEPSIKVADKIKKGKTLQVAVAPILTDSKSYVVKLFRDGKELSVLSQVNGSQRNFSVALPQKVKNGSRYQLEITEGSEKFYSNDFKIKPKVSRVWYAIPVIAVPVYLIISKYLEDNEPLPGPPSPTSD